jgi:hypothetical protein
LAGNHAKKRENNGLARTIEGLSATVQVASLMYNRHNPLSFFIKDYDIS